MSANAEPRANPPQEHEERIDEEQEGHPDTPHTPPSVTLAQASHPDSTGEGEPSAEEEALMRELAELEKAQRLAELCQKVQAKKDAIAKLSHRPRETTPEASAPGENSGRPRSETADNDEPAAKRHRIADEHKRNEYKGKTQREYVEFICAAEAVFEIRPFTYETDKDRVLFAWQYLKGDTQDAWYLHQESMGIENFTWKDFKDWLQNDLVPGPIRMARVFGKYKTAEQGDKQTATQLAAYMDTLEQQMDPLPEAYRIQFYLHALRGDLKQRMMEKTEVWVKRNDLVVQAALTEESLKEGKRSENKSRTGGPNMGKYHVHKGEQGRADNKDDRSTDTLAAAATSSSKSRTEHRGKDEKKPAQGKKDTPLSEVTCYNCNGKGHIARSCPKPCKDSDKDKSQGKDSSR
ncbi:MAG: hypothetical protein M1816_004026 [Peltula sp. TS41687]|nr:MAG: hypothetical protein M1816_004026 [Peltula sp. TS41687]